jgi:hypothetical protein
LSRSVGSGLIPQLRKEAAMAEICSAPLFGLSLQTGGMQATGATSSGNCPMDAPVHDVFEVI